MSNLPSFKPLLSLIAAGSLTLFLVGCEPGRDDDASPGASLREAGENLGDAASAAWQEAKKTSTESLDGLDGLMSDLESRAAGLSEDARSEIEDRLKQLREERTSISEQIEQWGDDARDGWEESVERLRSKMDDLERRLGELEQKFFAEEAA